MTDATSAARDQPLIAIDVVPMSFTTSDGLRVATARRQYAPYGGQEALPGVLLEGAELLADGARRALRTKTGIDAATVRHLAQIGAFDGPDRDPRSAAISVAFLAVVAPAVTTPTPAAAAAVVAPPSAAGPAVWRVPGGDDPRLPFDHDAIIRAALDHVRTRIWRDLPLTRALLGEVFTTSDASALQTALTGVQPDPGNTNRALRTNPALVRADASATAAVRGGRPPATWTWVD
ncbi:NUDIX domain-containing protein [Curtobacterium sp. GD1]|uniref:NUDIX domain-containing protein n=1 Tax=Curtobacterium sp. GD1 TaxID=2810612 RepID=UPI001E2F2D2B|nr:NUDIX domain-containing protein [Curtobacterium sp. GD1]MCC8907001.1 NUDIX hydrolase [Curtobacterium sp. GD1]